MIEVWAPSNIALIKYMGKTNAQGNLPTNSSISYTLDHFKTFVRLAENPEIQWAPLEMDTNIHFELSPNGKAKFLNHALRLKEAFGISKNFKISSMNDFPADCGLASSASSFAALSLAYALAANNQNYFGFRTENLNEMTGLLADHELLSLSKISRKGSGSSCRSLFSPWAIWDGEGARSVPELGGLKLNHVAIIIDAGKKEVSSSEAHSRVNSSLLFQGRPERANQRLSELVQSLKNNNWGDSQQIVWEEFWDMHVLFETSRPHFSYMNDLSLKVLRTLEKTVGDGRGPLITMDAGPNIHLLFRKDSDPLECLSTLRNLDLKMMFDPEIARLMQGRGWQL